MNLIAAENEITFGSLFTGIGGFDLGFERAGMKCLWQCEIEESCRRVLRRRFDADIYEDVTTINPTELAPVDVLCGGFPCQDLSVAGRRAGLAGERSGLWHEFHRIIKGISPRWVVIENVPGLFSSWSPVEPPPDAVEGSEWEVEEASDFETVVFMLSELGYCVSWRVFDAQYFGVAQRRERVFVVGSLGTGSSAEILFESEGVSWNPPARGEARAGTAGGFTEGAGGDGEPFTFDWQAGSTGDESFRGKARSWIEDKPGRTRSLTANRTLAVAYQCQGSNVGERGTLRAGNGNETGGVPFVIEAYGGNNTQGPIDVATACNAHGGTGRIDFESETFIAFTERTRKEGRNFECQAEPAYALTNPGSGGRTHSRSIAGPTGVRRLTPRECERLQGFPDNFTEGESDSARYRMLGNAVCVNVAEWLGQRLVDFHFAPAQIEQHSTRMTFEALTVE